jgi:hypothetical protein
MVNHQGIVAFVLGLLGGFMLLQVQHAYPFDNPQASKAHCAPGVQGRCIEMAQALGMSGIGSSGAQGRFDSTPPPPPPRDWHWERRCTWEKVPNERP